VIVGRKTIEKAGFLRVWGERPENDRMLNAVAVGFWQIAVGQLVASTG
jgi:hypothetical protein